MKNRKLEEDGMNFKKINNVWQLLGGGVLAPAIVTVLVLVWFFNPTVNRYQWLLWLHLPLLMFHEFEEYVLPGGFKDFINTKTFVAPDPPVEDVPASEPYCFAVNMGFWLWIILGALLANIAPWVGFVPVMLQVLINNFTHTFAFQGRQRGYNPGLVTTIVILMPYCTLVIGYIILANVFAPLDWFLGIVSGLIVMAVLLTITLTRLKRAKVARTA
jgi:hypothetical protein